MHAAKIARIVAVLALLLAGILVAEIIRIEESQRGVEARARAAELAKARAAAGKFGQDLAQMEAVVHDLRLLLESGRLKPGDAALEVGPALSKAPVSAVGLELLQAPGAGGLVQPSFACQARRVAGTVRTSLPSKEAAGAPLQAGWGERHPDRGGNGLLVDYAEPFTLPGAPGPSGLVKVEVDLEGIRLLVGAAESSASGYAFLLSAQGVYLADPSTERVRGGHTLLDVPETPSEGWRKALWVKALKGEEGFALSSSDITRQEAWIFLEPVVRAHWSLGLVVVKDEVVAPSRSTRGRVLRLVTWGLGLTLALLYLAFNGRSPTLRSLWCSAIAGALAAVLGTGTLWYFAYTLPPQERNDDIPVLDATGLQAFLDKHGRVDAGLSDVPAVVIPTGIFVETLDFTGPEQVRVTGKVWQRFAPGAPPEARSGVTFPESLSGDVENPVERQDGKDLVRISTFKILLKQKTVSGPNYPFDHARVRLWLRPKAIWRSEILAPDMEAYHLLIPTSLPGLEQEMNVVGWKVERSFFSYLFQTYNANFGMRDYTGQQNNPELTFNIAMRRNFLNPFIATFLPIVAALGLLFAAMLTISRDPSRLKATTYQCLNFLRTVVTLFFPVVVSQINLRSKIDADRLIYLEHYYFVVYGLILLVSADALVFALAECEWLNYEDNALAKMAYWPFLLVCFYLVSMQFLL